MQNCVFSSCPTTKPSGDTASALLDVAFQKNSIPLLIVDRELKIVTANASYRKFFHSNDENLVQLVNFTDCLAPASRDSLLKNHRKRLLLSTDIPAQYTLEIVDSNGIKSSFLLHIDIITPTQQSVISMIDLSAHDIAVQKRIPEPLQCPTPFDQIAANDLFHMEELKIASQMAAGVSHEIRNPMTTVRGFLQKLGQKSDFAKYQSYFQLMLEELDRANQIITEYLSLTKNKPDKISIENLNAIITQMFPLLQINALSSNKTILLDLSASLADLAVNGKEIRQLILNIVKNGLEAMQPGQNLRIKTYQSAIDRIMLEIQDEGGGIPAHLLNKIGTPFFTTKTSGTGLGLSICYTIAEKNNAAIKIASGKDGTTFFIEFRRRPKK